MGKDYKPVRLAGKNLKSDGNEIDKPAAIRRLKSGKSVYCTKAYAKALSKALGGGRKNKDGDYTLKENHIKNGKKGEIYFEHFHDPHRDEQGKIGKASQKKKGGVKIGHIYFGDGYEVT
ncbi:hypothetical protein [Phaeobacter piscinae]|uniref:hypothetical protein n=1 Tax=Phaeobacter piscinae TaxID=1580596 RepID=UPI000BBEA2EA|nr:hypothetical protein [Phaeobacter piscinae]ATG41726.1 hypothetical protein PhaeoP14_03694 [Phaeobacter piscinae]AUR38149.1 hypothetical protein PhaeoP18_03933 [Phaeobacter piscinae]